MVPFKETATTIEELDSIARKGFEGFQKKVVSKNDFLMYFGFTHGEAIQKFYPDNNYQVLVNAGFNTGSEAYFNAGINAWKNLHNGIYEFPPYKSVSETLFNQINIHFRREYLSVLRTKPFLLLAGISGTGKSRIVRQLAFKSCPSDLQDKDGTTPGNYCMIEVKPNWHDSSELLGYYSNISQKFIFTKFVKFLVKATMYPQVPFFVCLDEMNLAPVEQYFAEFLSVLETRKLNGDSIISGTLVSKEFFQVISKPDGQILNKPSDRDWYEYLCNVHNETNTSDVLTEVVSEYGETYTLKENGLMLPSNVFIIGTVNMDDTTHQFSRKVIDRAMTIEMNGEDLENMFGGSNDLTYETDDKIFTMDNIGARYVSADDVLEKCERVKNDEDVLRFITGKEPDGSIITLENTLPRRLNAINTILKNTPFMVSYRVLNELVIYLAVLLDEDKDNTPLEELANKALDGIMMMKILPRVEGDYDMFNQNGEENKLEELQKLFSEESLSYKKLDEMNNRLRLTEFTRFWP